MSPEGRRAADLAPALDGAGGHDDHHRGEGHRGRTGRPTIRSISRRGRRAAGARLGPQRPPHQQGEPAQPHADGRQVDHVDVRRPAAPGRPDTAWPVRLTVTSDRRPSPDHQRAPGPAATTASTTSRTRRTSHAGRSARTARRTTDGSRASASVPPRRAGGLQRDAHHRGRTRPTRPPHRCAGPAVVAPRRPQPGDEDGPPTSTVMPAKAAKRAIPYVPRGRGRRPGAAGQHVVDEGLGPRRRRRRARRPGR